MDLWGLVLRGSGIHHRAHQSRDREGVVVGSPLPNERGSTRGMTHYGPCEVYKVGLYGGNEGSNQKSICQRSTITTPPDHPCPPFPPFLRGGDNTRRRRDQTAGATYFLDTRLGSLYCSRSVLRHLQSRARQEAVAGHRFLRGAALRENLSFRAASGINRIIAAASASSKSTRRKAAPQTRLASTSASRA